MISKVQNLSLILNSKIGIRAVNKIIYIFLFLFLFFYLLFSRYTDLKLWKRKFRKKYHSWSCWRSCSSSSSILWSFWFQGAPGESTTLRTLTISLNISRYEDQFSADIVLDSVNMSFSDKTKYRQIYSAFY